MDRPVCLAASALRSRSCFPEDQKREWCSYARSTRTDGLSRGSIAKSSKPTGCPHSGTGHLVRNLPFESNTWIRLLIGSATYTLLVVGSTATEVRSVNCPSPLPSLPQVASTSTIGTELHDSVATLIDDINRVIRADSDPSRPVKCRRPLSDESPVRSEFLNAVLGAYLRDVNVAGAINGDSIRRFKLLLCS